MKKAINDQISKVTSKIRIRGMLYKEYKILFRKKKAPALVLLLPIILMIVYSAGTSAVNNTQTAISIGVCNNDPGAEIVINSLRGNFKINRLSEENCISELKNKVIKNELMIGISIPSNFMNNVMNGKQAEINYYVDDSKPITASMTSYYLEQGLRIYSQELIKSTESELRNSATNARDRLQSTIRVINSTSNILESNKALFGIVYPLMNEYLSTAINELTTYDDELAFVQNLSVEFLTRPISFNHETVYENVNTQAFNFASIYSMIALFTLLLLASTAIISDKKTNYLLRIKSTKTFMPTYMASKIIFYATIGLTQLFLVMGLIALQGATFNINWESLLITALMISITNTSIGMLIGNLSENENVAILISLTIALPFLFLSGIFFPLEFMPEYIQAISTTLPFNTQVMLLKQSSALNASINSISASINELVLFSIVSLTINYILIKRK